MIETTLLQGDSLSVYVGYNVKTKATFGPSGTVDMYDGFQLDVDGLFDGVGRDGERENH